MEWSERARRYLLIIFLISIIICAVGQFGSEVLANESLLDLLKEVWRF